MFTNTHSHRSALNNTHQHPQGPAPPLLLPLLPPRHLLRPWPAPSLQARPQTNLDG